MKKSELRKLIKEEIERLHEIDIKKEIVKTLTNAGIKNIKYGTKGVITSIDIPTNQSDEYYKKLNDYIYLWLWNVKKNNYSVDKKFEFKIN